MSVARLTPGRVVAVLATLAVLLGVSLLAAAAMGSVPIDLARAFDFGAADNPDFVILFRTRLPRVLLGAAVGSGLAAAGAALQALLRNSLASPDVIGVSGGASVGAMIALAFGADTSGWIVVPAAAFLGALASIFVILGLATVRGRLNPYSLLLVGVIVNSISAALILFVSTIAAPSQALGILAWMSGSLAERRYAWVAVIAVAVIVAMLALWSNARGLNLLSLGEEAATQLGVDVARLRAATFLASSLLVGAAVSVSGIIGFVGLIVPHCLRLVLGADHRLLIPASFLGGAIFLVWADTLARVLLAPTEVPVGVVTALCGGPFFIALLRRHQGRAS